MKFPQSNMKRKVHEQGVKKSVTPKVSLSKPMKNQRNLIQQKRVNTLPTAKTARVHRAQEN
jgi:hypothetical protein